MLLLEVGSNPMRDFVETLELENYLADMPIDPLAKMLDEVIKKGTYTK
jgi:hypothetical protein